MTKHRTVIINEGDRFGRLTVIKEVESVRLKNGKPSRRVLCKCDCGNIKEYFLASLTTGHTQSCGCLRLDRQLEKIKGKHKSNKFELVNDYYIGYTSSGDTFKFDIEDYDKVSCYCWYKSSNGYILSSTAPSFTLLHRLIMNPPDNLLVDHINGDKSDNRKSNLRICNYSQNSMNKYTKGYIFRKDTKKWRAYIKVNGKQIALGCYNTEEEAIKARRAGELKYFGEFAYQGGVSNS